MSEIEAPKVYLTDAQWEHVKANEDIRTREMMRHNALVQKSLTDAIEMMSSSQSVGNLRDIFAGQALAGLYACRELQLATLHDAKSPGFEGVMARQVYLQADAMIAAREVKP